MDNTNRGRLCYIQTYFDLQPNADVDQYVISAYIYEDVRAKVQREREGGGRGGGGAERERERERERVIRVCLV